MINLQVRQVCMMNKEFREAGRGVDWLSWLGMPIVYDGGLCVNRTLEERIEHMKHPNATLVV